MCTSRNSLGSIVVASVVAFVAFATVANAGVISVNFKGTAVQADYTNPSNIGPSVTTAAGVVHVSNWNNAQGPSGTISSGSLIDSSGAVVAGASVSYSSPNLYNAYAGTPPSGTGDVALMQGYLDNFSNLGYSITVSGLGTPYTSSGYYVLAYQNTDSAGSFGYKVTDSNTNTALAYGQQLAANGANYPLGGTNGYVGSTSTNPAGPGTAANYVLLTGFNGSSFTLTGLAGASGDGRARIDGFQIVEVPEPSTIVLGCVGAIGLFVVARRRRKV